MQAADWLLNAGKSFLLAPNVISYKYTVQRLAINWISHSASHDQAITPCAIPTEMYGWERVGVPIFKEMAH